MAPRLCCPRDRRNFLLFFPLLLMAIKAFLARTYDQVWVGLGFLPLTLSSCRSDEASPDWIALLKDERRNGGPRLLPSSAGPPPRCGPPPLSTHKILSSPPKKTKTRQAASSA